MRTISKSLLPALLLGLVSMAFTTPAMSSSYTDDLQAQYPKDRTQDTFQMASMVACVIRSFAPEQNVGIGQYLAYWDDNKCNDSGASATVSTGSGGASQVPPKMSKALVTVTQTATNALRVEALLKLTDQENGVDVPKDIQVIATINSGAKLTPPYGDWTMDFCSSLVGNEGSCNDGQGYLRVNGDGITVYNRWSHGYRAGRSVFTGAGGTAGYGAVYSQDSVWTSENSNALFSFAPGAYKLKDRGNNQEFCFDPSISASGVRYSTWENFLYNRSSGERIAYENPGFYLTSDLSGQRVGDVTSFGVNFWQEASSADQLDGATLLRADDNSQAFTLKKAPGRLQKVSTSILTSLDSVEDIPLNLSVWGSNSRGSVNTATLLTDLLGRDQVSNPYVSNGLAITSRWTKPSGSSEGYFTFSDYQDCASGECILTQLPNNVTRTLTQLFNLGINNLNGWVNGVNVSYQTNLTNWVNNTQVLIPQATLKLVKQTSEVVDPADTTVPTNLVCVGTCPAVSGNNLIDNSSPYWPPLATSVTSVTWNRSLSAPTVTNGSVTKTVDWRSSNVNNGHWYQLYRESDLASMACTGFNGTGPAAAYCPQLLTEQANSTYYTWQSGNRWDAYNYLVYQSGANAGTAVKPNPPLNLSYAVTSSQGTEPGYVGKTITVQSPQPGNIWLPGYCVDKNLVQKSCSADTDWVNTVSIPTAADDTGSVTLLNRNGTPTATKYYAKWLKRGVFFQSINAASCSPLADGITSAENVTLPGNSGFDQSVKAIGLPWPTNLFNASPRVIEGTLQ